MNLRGASAAPDTGRPCSRPSSISTSALPSGTSSGPLANLHRRRPRSHHRRRRACWSRRRCSAARSAASSWARSPTTSARAAPASLGIALTFVPLLLGWLVVDSYRSLLLMALLLGVPGASFAVALAARVALVSAAASRAGDGHRRRRQLGNGARLAASCRGSRPRSAGIPRSASPHPADGIAAALVFVACAKDSPTQPPPQPVARVRRRAPPDRHALVRRLLRITFGGFVGLASVLAIFFHDHYGVAKVARRRPHRALRLRRQLHASARRLARRPLRRHPHAAAALRLVAVLLLGIATLPPLAAAVPLFVARARACSAPATAPCSSSCRCASSATSGLITGLVGAAGGLGGFFLPSMLGLLPRRDRRRGRAGFAVLAAVCFWGMTLIARREGRLAASPGRHRRGFARRGTPASALATPVVEPGARDLDPGPFTLVYCSGSAATSSTW